MAKLIYSSIASLDGYVADEDGNFDWGEPDQEVHTFVNDLQRPVGTYLYGRRLYEVMVAWETMNLAGQPVVAPLGAPSLDVAAGHLLDRVGVLLTPRLNRVDVKDSDPPGAVPEHELERPEPWLSVSVGAEGEVIRAILGIVRPARSDPPNLEVAGPEDLADVGAVCLASHQQKLKAAVESRIAMHRSSVLALREEIWRHSGAGKSLDAAERDKLLEISRDKRVARLRCALAEGSPHRLDNRQPSGSAPPVSQ
jgi:hypothetical protein